jgi:TRAP-type C4-dicarboxylate transport system permease small subunit
MRKALDRLYDAAAVLAALFLIATLVFIALSIAGRILNFHVRGTDAYAGYAMAACGFLALAHTLKRGEHIRVTMLINHVGPRAHRALQLWCHAVATLASALFASFSVRLAWQSYTFNDVSTANDATPLWIPQIAMALGTFILFVAFVDELVVDIRGGRHARAGDEPTHVE